MSASPDTSVTLNASAARSNRHYEVTRDGLAVFFGTVKDVSEATEILAPLKATCALIVRALEITKSINDNKTALHGFVKTLEDQAAFFKTFTADIDKEGRAEALLRPALAPYEAEVNAICKEATRVKAKMDSRSTLAVLLKRIGRHKLDSEQVNGWNDRMNTAHKYLTMSFQMVISTQLLGASRDLKAIRQDLKNFSASRPAKYAHDSLSRSIYGLDLDRCETGTQTNILDLIRQWADDATARQIFWLSGDRGVGKTTIVASMSDEWIVNGSLGGRFFFSQDDRATSTTHEFCRAISRDIAAHNPVLEPVIEAAIASTSLKHFPLEQQLQRMIIEPVARYGQQIIIVVDGLDSVTDTHVRHGLLKLLVKELPRAPTLKMLFTSPAFMEIEDVLGNSELVQRYDVQLPGTSDNVIHPDIALYIQKHLKMLTEDMNGRNGQRTMVASLSKGSLLWLVPAAFLLKKSKRRPDLITQMGAVDPPHHLDHLYYISIERVVHGMWHSDLKMDLLRIVMTVMEPVPLRTLYSLLPQRDQSYLDVERMVRLLGGVIKSGDSNLPVRVRHASFRDFCLDRLRARDFHVDLIISHQFLALTCLNFLEQYLCHNILGIDLKGEVLPGNLEIPDVGYILKQRLENAPILAYASSYWPFHIARCLNNRDVVSMATKFLRNQLLAWIELMSWRGRIENTIDGLAYLEQALKSSVVSGEDNFELQAFTTQALSFVQRNREIVERSALQVYCSALCFAVDGGALLQGYQELHKERCPKVIVLGDHTSSVGTRINAPILAISPDGSLLASVAGDFSIELKMSSTGDLDERKLSGHKVEITSLHFSLDGQLLAAGSVDGQVRIWSVNTGSQIHSIEHPGAIVEAIFSPNRSSIAVISCGTEGDNRLILRLWDLAQIVESRNPSVTFLYKESFKVVIFSSDCKSIAAITERGLFEVRDASSGALLSGAEVGLYPSHIALSSDGRRLAISSDLQIQLWDVATPAPELIAAMELRASGHLSELSISPNGKYLVYGSTVWDIETIPAAEWNGLRLPAALQRYTRGPGSLLSYQDGQIHSVYPRGVLLEMPPYYGINSSTLWRAHGSKIIFAPENGQLIVVDCSPLLP